MNEIWQLIIGGGVAVTVIEGAKSGIGWIVKRIAAKKDKQEEKDENKVKEQIAEIERKVGQIEDNMDGIGVSLQLQKKTNMLILFDRLRYLARCYISDGAISFEDRDTWNMMHECYHENGGNGAMKPTAELLNALPIKKG